MNPIESFFRELDARLDSEQFQRTHLQIVGFTALFLLTPYLRGTKDSDAVQTYDFDPAVRHRLLQLAGEGTSLAVRNRIYLEFVAEGLPRQDRVGLRDRMIEGSISGRS